MAERVGLDLEAQQRSPLRGDRPQRGHARPLGGGDGAAPRDQGFLQSLGADMLAARVTGHRGGDRPFMDADAAVEDYYRTARIALIVWCSTDFFNSASAASLRW